MSKRFAVTAGLLGMIAGALIGSAYLDGGASCADVSGPKFSCTMNHSIAPFIGCIAIGFVLGIAIARNGQKLWHRFTIPAEIRNPDRSVRSTAAAPVDIATWGRTPGSKGVVVDPGSEPAQAEAPPPRPRDVSLGSRGKPRPTPRSQG